MAKGPEAFRTISEAADELHVPQHVLRFWETKFSFIRPMKRAGGRRFYRPQDILVPDQFFDRTKGRVSTFFGRGLVAHIAFAHPVCPDLSKVLADSADEDGVIEEKVDRVKAEITELLAAGRRQRRSVFR